MSPIIGVIDSSKAKSSPAFDSIATATPASGASSVTFSSIPSTYQHLQLRVSARRNADGSFAVSLRFNGDFGNNYMTSSLQALGTSVGTNAGGSETEMRGIYVQTGTRIANNYGMAIYDIMDYNSTSKLKSAIYRGGFAAYNTVDTGNAEFGGGTWNNTAAITQIQCVFRGDAADAGCRFELYGIKGS